MSRRSEARNQRHDAKNIHAPEGTHWCYMHNGGRGAYLPKENFNKNRSKFDGLDSKCRECAREYRIAHEAKHGRRTDHTKTLRVPPRTHALVGRLANVAGLAHYEFVKEAVAFYDRFACKEGCGELGDPELHGVCSSCMKRVETAS